MENINLEKIKYLLAFFETYITQLIDNVLVDSKEDPHYSAVAATNLIKCYIQAMTEVGENLPYDDAKSFMDINGYTEDEYTAFEIRRLEESKYYRGVQY